MSDEETKAATDINLLFSRDPMQLTDDDITDIIVEYRKRRVLFNASPSTPAAKKTPKLTEGQKAASMLQIELKL